MRPSFHVEESVSQLGAHIKTARLRRRMPQAVVAERAGISLNTLSKIENGDCGVSIGNLTAVLHSLGFTSPWESVASPGEDMTGMLLDERRLPQRARVTRKDKE